MEGGLSSRAAPWNFAAALADGKEVGWFQGRMELSVHERSATAPILADPRSPTVLRNLNLKVKYREGFRPFAPSVLRENVSEWFDLAVDSPYMLLVAGVAEQHRRTISAAEHALFGIDLLNVSRSSMPAVTHVDCSARIQTVHRETNLIYHALMIRCHALTGFPILSDRGTSIAGAASRSCVASQFLIEQQTCFEY